MGVVASLQQALQFPNLRRKGGKFDHRPERPKVLLRHWPYRSIATAVAGECGQCHIISVRRLLNTDLFSPQPYICVDCFTSTRPECG